MIVESWLARATAGAPDRIAVQDGERALTYAELLGDARAGAAALAASGVKPGERVAIALGPGIPFAVALHACWLAGASVVPVDVRLSAAERDAICAGAAMVIEQPLPGGAAGGGAASGPAGEGPAGGPPRGGPARGEPAARAAGTTGAAASTTHDLAAVAAVIHTSGTTSRPKPVELTFGNLLWSAQGSAVALGADPRERWLCTLPVCHVGGLSILVRSTIFATTAVLHERFETQRALHALMHEDITIVSVVATTLARLLDAGLEHPPALRAALAGGGPVPAALLERAAAAGVPVCQTYGLTESCSQVSTVPLAALRSAEPAASHGAGRPLFCTRVRIDADGEILVAGPTVAPGAVSPDGWLHTGDLGSLDANGNLHVSGRKADTIISGGENVAPAEVEAVLEAHAQVSEAAVVGRSDPRWGEAVTAIVVPREGASIDPETLRRHCADSLAPYKVPKQVVLISGPLPRTRSGKLLRREVEMSVDERDRHTR
jgi:o-succinylbenzoate---CoA ligase